MPFLREGAFDAQGIVTVPHVKLLRKLGRLRSEQLREVELSVNGEPVPVRFNLSANIHFR